MVDGGIPKGGLGLGTRVCGMERRTYTGAGWRLRERYWDRGLAAEGERDEGKESVRVGLKGKREKWDIV